MRLRTVFYFSLLAFFLLTRGDAAGFSRDKSKVTGTAEVNGTKLYYEVMGKGRALVLIHGGLVDSRMWDEQFKEFARHYKVIRYDLRGFGKSAFPTAQYSHVEDVHALLKFLKVERASVIGLSLGGMIAVDFTLEHPEMVEALIPAGAAVRGYQYVAVGNRQEIFKAAADGGAEKAVALWLDDPVFVTAKKYPAVQAKMRAMLTDNFKGWSSIAPNLLTWPAQPSIEQLPKIKVPTLVIVGDQDNANILGIAEILHAKIAGAKKHVIAGAGHHLNMERPGEFNKNVLGFLKKT